MDSKQILTSLGTKEPRRRGFFGGLMVGLLGMAATGIGATIGTAQGVIGALKDLASATTEYIQHTKKRFTYGRRGYWPGRITHEFNGPAMSRRAVQMCRRINVAGRLGRRGQSALKPRPA